MLLTLGSPEAGIAAEGEVLIKERKAGQAPLNLQAPWGQRLQAYDPRGMPYGRKGTIPKERAQSTSAERTSPISNFDSNLAFKTPVASGIFISSFSDRMVTS